jgi:hypothetical protein
MSLFGAPRASHCSIARVILVYVLLIGFTGLQTAREIESHPHQHSGPHAHCCPACHAGHLPLVQALPIFEVSAPVAMAWRSWEEPKQLAGEYVAAFTPSRAPPTTFFS